MNPALRWLRRGLIGVGILALDLVAGALLYGGISQ